MNVFSDLCAGKSPSYRLRPSAFAVYPSDRFEIRMARGRLIRDVRWTRARSGTLASNYGPANQESGRPERARGQATLTGPDTVGPIRGPYAFLLNVGLACLCGFYCRYLFVVMRPVFGIFAVFFGSQVGERHELPP